MTYSKDEYISKFGKDAFFLLKSIFNTGKLSYFGGYPTLPKNIKWPTTMYSGKVVQLPFLAQINLADLSETQEELPKAGILYFFYDITFDERARPYPVCVVYSDSICNEITLPTIEMLPSFNDEMMMTGLFLFRHKEVIESYPRACFPKYEISPVKFKDIGNPIYSYNEENRDDRRDEQDRIISDQIDLTYKINCFEHQYKTDLSIYEVVGRENLPQWLVGQIEYMGNRIEKGTFVENWPQAWLHIEFFCTVLTKELKRGNQLQEVNENYQLLLELQKETDNWLYQSKLQKFDQKVPRNISSEFKNWVTNSYLSSVHNTSKSKVLFKIRIAIETSISSFPEARNWLIDLTANGTSTFNKIELERIESYIKVSCRQPHQVLGYGIPDGARTYDEGSYQDSILLLQLGFDDTMMWGFGDLDCLQFRISQKDLKELRFDKATMELIM
ncbi:DUF1963 domain-containing protein [Thalassolituus oleivorans]|uniref:DUF1963 domain-containing protein n=1 Tax=Thalassolituus oleivorans MIL-1 TaxID=1298593 RepID=M5DSF7_9GAMM|nr:DUF1963 domain-containing protein [Thalassolituus oleivorans]CCU72366.1 hypothetical protein TOL_1957 [Thalassolituus oleivorans MIL-1]